MHRRTQNGFSLIEVLIVVAILGIIAAIAIPNLLASRRAANEGSAQISLRMIHSAEQTFRGTVGNGSYADMKALDDNKLVDTTLASGTKSGYQFTVNTFAATSERYAGFWSYTLPTQAEGVTRTGTRRFAIADDGVLRGDYILFAPADYDAVVGNRERMVDWMPPLGF